MTWKGLVLLLLAAYLLVALGACAIAPSMMFHPAYGSRAVVPGSVALTLPNGSVVHALHLPNPQARQTIWYFHGNAEDLGDVAPAMQRFVDAGFAVWVCDYPGYGRGTGKPSEDSLYAAARVARDYLRRELKVPAERTLIYGTSLGSGPAVQMAVEERVGGLILQSPFMSAYRVLTRWPLLPGDPFQNLNKLTHVRSPVLVIHGRRDGVVPFFHGERIFAGAREPKRNLWVEGAGHNDLWSLAGPACLNAVREFSELCARPAPSGSSL